MMGRFTARWNDFFFAKEVPYGMALVRITLPPVLLIGVLPRWFYVRELYSSDGAPSPLWLNYGTAPFLPDLPPPVAVALYALLIASLLAVMVGWKTRVSLVTACVLYASFGILDSVSTLTKYTVIASHILMLLAFSECGSLWSVDAWLRPKRRAGLPARSSFPVWPARLIQLFIGIVYVGAAFTKMHTPAYFTGDQLTSWMLADLTIENRLGEWLTLYPPLIAVMAYVTILWEVLFIVLVWSSFWRVPALMLGVLFHVMTYFTLGLVDFPLIYLSAYFVYMQPEEAERAAVLANRLFRRLHLSLPRLAPSASGGGIPPSYLLAGWSLVMMAAAVAGVEVEHRQDVYRRHTAAGPLPLKTLDTELVAEMLGPARRLRPQDMYYAFDIGTSTLGGLLSDRRETFTYGEQAIVQCSFHPPHPDMWIEVNMRDDEGHVLKRIGQIMPRENLRAEFYYAFDDSFVPGAYDFVLQYDGEELTRRRVTLAGQPPALTAAR